MALLERWFRKPQSVFLRRALFQIHLWTGIGVGLYVFAVSVSGSAIVFRTELSKSKLLEPQVKTVAVSGRRLTSQELTADAERAHPNYSVVHIWDVKQQDQAIDVWLERNESMIERQFDPYTGQDLGRSVPYSLALLGWLVDLHGNLLAGSTGRTVNGIGGIFLVVLSVTGAVIWWPGIESWRRSMKIDWRAPWKRFNWDLHSAVGFWLFAFVLIWGFTGAYLVFPEPVDRTINHFSPLAEYTPVPPRSASTQGNPGVGNIVITPPNSLARRLYGRRQLSFGDKTIRWFSYLHYGNFGGWQIKTLWVLLGLVPPFLFVTGALMWWNRVLSPFLRRRLSAAPAPLKEASEARADTVRSPNV